MSIQKLLQNSCERTETKYNMVVHRKLWRKGAAAVEFGDGIANCCFIISVKTIFQTFFVQKFKKPFLKLLQSFIWEKAHSFRRRFPVPKTIGNFAGNQFPRWNWCMWMLTLLFMLALLLPLNDTSSCMSLQGTTIALRYQLPGTPLLCNKESTNSSMFASCASTVPPGTSLSSYHASLSVPKRLASQKAFASRYGTRSPIPPLWMLNVSHCCFASSHYSNHISFGKNLFSPPELYEANETRRHERRSRLAGPGLWGI